MPWFDNSLQVIYLVGGLHLFWTFAPITIYNYMFWNEIALQLVGYSLSIPPKKNNSKLPILPGAEASFFVRMGLVAQSYRQDERIPDKFADYAVQWLVLTTWFYGSIFSIPQQFLALCILISRWASQWIMSWEQHIRIWKPFFTFWFLPVSSEADLESSTPIHLQPWSINKTWTQSSEDSSHWGHLKPDPLLDDPVTDLLIIPSRFWESYSPLPVLRCWSLLCSCYLGQTFIRAKITSRW